MKSKSILETAKLSTRAANVIRAAQKLERIPFTPNVVKHCLRTGFFVRQRNCGKATSAEIAKAVGVVVPPKKLDARAMQISLKQYRGRLGSLRHFVKSAKAELALLRTELEKLRMEESEAKSKLRQIESETTRYANIVEPNHTFKVESIEALEKLKAVVCFEMENAAKQGKSLEALLVNPETIRKIGMVKDGFSFQHPNLSYLCGRIVECAAVIPGQTIAVAVSRGRCRCGSPDIPFVGGRCARCQSIYG